MVGVMKRQGLFLACLLWLLGWSLGGLVPGVWWLQVSRFAAFDGPAGAAVMLDVDRRIRRGFTAEWHVLVRRWAEGGWVVVCAAHGGGDYRRDAALPSPVPLEWWTEGACSTLPPGRYLIATIWTIDRSLWPDRVVAVESNVFTVS